jgi:hypothetical protein
MDGMLLLSFAHVPGGKLLKDLLLEREMKTDAQKAVGVEPNAMFLGPLRTSAAGTNTFRLPNGPAQPALVTVTGNVPSDRFLNLNPVMSISFQSCVTAKSTLAKSIACCFVNLNPTVTNPSTALFVPSTG